MSLKPNIVNQSSLPNIIKLSQIHVVRVMACTSFDFSGANYIKKVRVVCLACGTPTGPPLYSYQILSKYVLGCQSYGGHKFMNLNFCFRVDNCITKKVRVVSLAHDRPTVPPHHLY